MHGTILQGLALNNRRRRRRNSGVRIGPLARDALERLCRYILRPALCNARMERLADGRIVVKLKRTWSSDFREPRHVVFPHAEVAPRRRYLSPSIYSRK